ncbi:MAG: DUF1830 domain-containing protein [Xenococcus sp. (in: cyanobacteria)]
MLSVPQVASQVFTLCCYVNRTDKIQIGRIVNIEQWYFEKVIFPQQRLLFDAPPEAELEIYADERVEVIRIHCNELAVNLNKD